MKTKTKRICHLQLRQLWCSPEHYIDWIAKLEKALAAKPRRLEIEMIGPADVPADFTLLIRSLLLARSPQTRLVTVARSSLMGGSVLIWLLGDERSIREDAHLYLRRPTAEDGFEKQELERWNPTEVNSFDPELDLDPDESDYARILHGINQYLPVSELAGRIIGVQELQQFGLIGTERVDHFLANVFRRNKGRLIPF